MCIRMKNVSGKIWQTMKILGVYKCLWRDQQHEATSPKWSNKKPRRKKSAVSVGRRSKKRRQSFQNDFSFGAFYTLLMLRAAIMAAKHVHEEIALAPEAPRKYCPTHFYSNKTPIWIILNKCCHITRSYARGGCNHLFKRRSNLFTTGALIKNGPAKTRSPTVIHHSACGVNKSTKLGDGEGEARADD
jgi:hypothetical protein